VAHCGSHHKEHFKRVHRHVTIHRFSEPQINAISMQHATYAAYHTHLSNTCTLAAREQQANHEIQAMVGRIVLHLIGDVVAYVDDANVLSV
jgi:hypothetical protein